MGGGKHKDLNTMRQESLGGVNLGTLHRAELFVIFSYFLYCTVSIKVLDIKCQKSQHKLAYTKRICMWLNVWFDMKD